MKNKIPFVLMVLCVAVFAAGIAELVKLRFEAGDVYPAYSSLRFDPLGTSALYESLSHLPGISVSRDFQMTDEMPEGKNVAYLHLAADEFLWRNMPESTFKEVDSFLRRGGRLVIAFYPQVGTEKSTLSFNPFNPKTKKPKPTGAKPKDGKDDSSADKDKSTNDKHKKDSSSADKSKSAKPDQKNPPENKDEDSFEHAVSIPEKWGYEFAFHGMTANADSYAPIEVENNHQPSLPSKIFWHSGMTFTNIDKSWKVIYSRDGDPVLMERRFGSGSVVMSSDSYFLSNEALEKDRHTDLLAWIVGPSRTIVFDEAHLGIVENPGVAGLIRRYRLEGLMAGLLLLAALFIWKNSVSFVPRLADEDVELHVVGKDSAAGFINLLRRHINPHDVLATCLVEWKKSFGKGAVSTVRLARVQAVIDADNARAPKDRHPIQTYRDICRALKEGRGKSPPISETQQ